MSLALIAHTLRAAADPDWRKANGGNQRVAIELAGALASAPKDRSADYLICGAKDHPALERVRHECLHMSMTNRLSAVGDQKRSLHERAVIAWYVSGMECSHEKRIGNGDLVGLMELFRQLGVPSELVDATARAAKRTREPITVMVPLVWLS